MRLLSCLHNLFCWALFATGLLFVWQASYADQFLARILEYRSAQQSEGREENDAPGAIALPAGVQLVRDVAYGADRKQRMDVYLPQHAVNAPVIFMVHGGAWRFGDKNAKSVVENKVARWVAKGCIFISVNYRLLPKTMLVDQAADIASALAVAQAQAASWGGDPEKFILMGHSAGAHLVALLAAAPERAYKLGAKPWLGTIALDSAALDVAEIMLNKHERFYDSAFGEDPTYWKEVSPLYSLSKIAKPILAVCSTHRKDSCPQAVLFASRAKSQGVRVDVLEQDLSHREINLQLGTAGSYTDAVEAFMSSLDESVKRALDRPSGSMH
ncbi:MAG: alpha/beta hydrolase [Sulfuriferula sp.]|nr:alpha/beta hydrolase [Sulfuriferula sp.]